MELTGTVMDRRSFLRGSALFAGALGLAVVPAFAQEPPQQQQQQPPPPQDPEAKPKEKPKDPFDTGEKPGDSKKLIDKEGREYRICPQCGYNMYKEGRMWVCENCGYSYVE
jgi:ribosomal protein S27AE